MPDETTIEVDGRAAAAADLFYPALVNYGHFTVMQVRGGRVRGLDLHLRRLVNAHQELFGTDLDPSLVRAHLRHALAAHPDASVRLIAFQRDNTPSVLVAVWDPTEVPAAPQRLMSAPYQRPVPHIKHVGGFGQRYWTRQAQRHGFDDALLTGPGGVIAEASVANVAFWDGTAVVWPDAPCLSGITMQLLEPRLPVTRRAPVLLADVPSYRGAFVANSTGVVPVAAIDDLTLPVDADLMRTVGDVYDSVPWDEI
jgi:branched-subunit amino acid aminotransferase/4-amino-4-deoxychorismate lyase